MQNISEYKIISRLHDSFYSIVYRGRRIKDNLPVILKKLKQDYPSYEEITQYKQQYEITHNLNIENVIKSYALEKYQNTFIIIFEDFDGNSLKVLREKQEFTLETFLKIAIKITQGLAEIHDANIIHKDINPSNIVFNPKTEQLKIIDFGISTVLPKEKLTPKNPNTLEGTLAYISPEQTGRMNCSLDCRSDFYSLGVAFYELLTDRLPFQSEDLLELIHCHIAKKPTPPQKLNPKIPQAISDIVLKLMAKNPEKRYQSACGIKVDLETCLNRLQTTNKIGNLQLGTQDISNKFQVKQKLYGRKKEIEILLKAIGKSKFQKEIILIYGYSGIGKSALVKEIYKPVTEARGFFATGKFDQYQRDRPYSAIVQAFRQLAKYLLAESITNLDQWKTKLLEALKGNGPVIIDLIPEIEQIIGKQSTVASLSPMEAQNRFNWSFIEFVKVFAKNEHPLVIFLDDLQWADNASLELIQSLMIDETIEYLFLVGAYRNNEVNPLHPLLSTIREIETAKVPIKRIFLSPLKLSDIKNLITDSLNCKLETAEPLAKLVLSKTNGNPFFINEFLQSLYQKNLLSFNNKTRDWKWDLEKIKKQNITDNLAELLFDSIGQLKPTVQQILKLAACIGNQFKIESLAIISQSTPQETALLLREAILTGLIFPLNDAYKGIELGITPNKDKRKIGYKFTHDRIQQAAYSLIPPKEKSIYHWRIGQLLLKNNSSKQQESQIFDLVNQLNLGVKSINNQEQKSHLAKLNLIAGKKAKRSAAYKTAYKYFKQGILLLSKNSWQIEYKLTLSLYVQTVEAAYLSGDFEEMEYFIQKVLEEAKTALDTVKVYEVKIEAQKAQKQLLEALKTGLLFVERLGVFIPKNPTELDVEIEAKKIKRALKGKTVVDLINLPPMTDPKVLAVMQIFKTLSAATCYIAPEIFLLIVSKSVNLSIEYGNCYCSILTYTQYGTILCFVLKDIELGYNFGKLSLDLLEKFKIDAQEIKTATLANFNFLIRHWKEHLKQTLPPLFEGYQNGLETGDFEYSGFCLVDYSYQMYFVAEKLPQLQQLLKNNIEALDRLKQEISRQTLQMLQQVIVFLTKEKSNNHEILSIDSQTKNPIVLLYLYCLKLILCYLFDDSLNAVKTSNIISDNNKKWKCIIGMPVIPVTIFYDSLTKTALSSSLDSNPQQQKDYLKQVSDNQNKMKIWAYHAPMNYQHKYDLVEAELHRVKGNKEKAIDLYEKAIEGADKYEYLNEEALACELAAKFYLEWGKAIAAKGYMIEAHYKYKLWGATAKVKQLEKKYPELLSSDKNRRSYSDDISTISEKDTSKIKLESIDLAILVKTNQTISNETDLDKLLALILDYSLKAVGAQTGSIILNESGKDLIKGKAKIKGKEIVIQTTEQVSQTEFPESVVCFVKNSRKTVIENNASTEGKFINDKYIVKHGAKSILCLPLVCRGNCVGVIYLENNLSTDVFKEDGLGVLELITTQAAISIENAMLRRKKSYVSDYYQLGGSLKVDSPTYVVREADEQLYDNLMNGNYCYLLNPRQMGKSSLRVQVHNKFKSLGYKCAVVDISSIGTQQIEMKQWYYSLIDKLQNRFSELESQNFDSELDSLHDRNPAKIFNYFVEQILLPNVKGDIIIFFDEIDSIRALSYSLKDFFIQLRYFYQSRVDCAEFERITFVLIGATLPTYLLKDPIATPFNIGTRIKLSRFKLEQTQPLIDGIKEQCSNPRVVMEEILAWTGGQPFLTQVVCSLISTKLSKIVPGQESKTIASLVKTEIIENWQDKDRSGHLGTIQTYILKNKEILPDLLLKMYREILLSEETIFDRDSPEQEQLLIIGIIKAENNLVKVSNRIYEFIFNLRWIDKRLKSSSS